jgi:hypothetical protein
VPEPQAASAAVRKKAGRLLAEQRVAIGWAAYVQGDHDEYVVSYKDGVYKCGCPARVRCAHITAVDILIGRVRAEQ